MNIQQWLLGTTLILNLTACATIVKSEKIPVRFVGGLSSGDTQINLPDGQYNLKNGQTTVLVTRSKDDIPITVTCNSETREGIIQTKYDALAGVAGNIIFGGVIGVGIDAFNNKTYDPPGVYNLSPLCSEKPTVIQAVSPGENSSRDPASKNISEK